jgi:transmembrane 9 superfamily protein 3
MTYSVKWVQTNVAFARRFEVYLDYPFFEHQVILIRTRDQPNISYGHFDLLSLSPSWFWQRWTLLLSIFRSCKWLTNCIFHAQIHWFSIFNSFMMVIFLTGLVSMILMRTLRNDYAKYAREDDDLESLVSSESEVWTISVCLCIC